MVRLLRPAGVMADGNKTLKDRRKSPDRRVTRGPGGPLDDRKTRFSVGYLVVAFLALVALNYLIAGQGAEQIAYSEFKDKVRAGQVKEVRLGASVIQAVPIDSVKKADKVQTWSVTRTGVENDEALYPLLDSRGVEYTGLPVSWLSGILGWVLPFALIALFWFWIIRRMSPTQGVLTVGKSRARIMGEEGTGVGFEDVAGVDEAKQELVEVVEFLRTPEKFANLGAKIPKGVLLVGPPGTGKTLIARAVAGEAGVTFFSISGAEFVEMFVGVGAARVRDLFAQDKAQAP